MATSGAISIADKFITDPDLVKMRKDFSPKFYEAFEEGVKCYQ